VPDSAAQLQRIYLAGFDLQTFDRFPKCVGVVRDGCIALLVPTPQGLQMLGTPGWRMGEAIGVLVERDGQQVFQAKSDIVEATQERLDTLRRFRSELEALLAA
jgi:glucose dehydrogenase